MNSVIYMKWRLFKYEPNNPLLRSGLISFKGVPYRLLGLIAVLLTGARTFMYNSSEIAYTGAAHRAGE